MVTDPNIVITARTMFGEARNQGPKGLQAVANVIMNRVAQHTWYGLTPYEVCVKPMQFSCWNLDDPNRKIITAVTDNDPIFAECLNLADMANDGQLPDLTNGATHYRVIGTKASWDPNDSLKACATIGKHEFFNDVA